jgi:predicted O-methyltransferase YrrM
MTFFGGVNDALERSLGVRVLRAKRVQALRSKARAATAARNELRERDVEIERLKRNLGAKPKGSRLPADYDAGFADLWESVRERTMTSHEKVFGLYRAVRYILRHDIPGAVVECGVWRGGSMLAVARAMDQLDVRNRDLYLFDTYEGMTEPTERDVQVSGNKSAIERLAAEDRSSWVWAVASLEDVQQGFEDIRYPAERIHFVKGPVEETVPERAPEEISILRLDTDWYASTKHELEHLYHRLAPGGVLIIDDYGKWQGSKDATDEFLAGTGEPLLLLRTATGRIGVRPGLPSKVDVVTK